MYLFMINPAECAGVLRECVGSVGASRKECSNAWECVGVYKRMRVLGVLHPAFVCVCVCVCVCALGVWRESAGVVWEYIHVCLQRLLILGGKETKSERACWGEGASRKFLMSSGKRITFLKDSSSSATGTEEYYTIYNDKLTTT